MARSYTLPLLVGAAGAGALYYAFADRPGASPGPSPGPGSSDGPSEPSELSARRKAVLAYLGDVLPSKYPDKKFMTIVGPKYDPKDPTLPEGYTTCGALPCYIGRMLGVVKPWCITLGGLESMRTLGRDAGAWIEPDEHNHPRPGDFYASGGPAHGALNHVGVFVKSEPLATALEAARADLATAKDKWGKWTAEQKVKALESWGSKGINEVWTTADAGQGTRLEQSADYTVKGYSPAIHSTYAVNGERRTIAGWYDVDKAPGAKP